MPHLALGILIMLIGAAVMACGLYVRAIGPAYGSSGGRTLANVTVMVVLLLIGLAIAVAGIIISFEPSSISPR
jgi:hypothetical protein